MQLDETTNCTQMVAAGTITTWTNNDRLDSTTYYNSYHPPFDKYGVVDASTQTYAGYYNLKASTITVPRSICPNLPLVALYVPGRSSTQISAGVEQMTGSILRIQNVGGDPNADWIVWIQIMGAQVNRTDPSPAVDYYVFGAPQADSGYGINIVNSSGGIAFSSKSQLMIIKGLLTGPGSVSVPAGRKYAFITNQPAQSPIIDAPITSPWGAQI